MLLRCALLWAAAAMPMVGLILALEAALWVWGRLDERQRGLVLAAACAAAWLAATLLLG